MLQEVIKWDKTATKSHLYTVDTALQESKELLRLAHAKTGETTGKGVFTIVEVKAGQGASVGWGRLKSGAGWISLDYATRLA